MTDPRSELADVLRSRAGDLAACPVVAGFDGFVDEMIEVVDERQDLETYQPLSTITRFSEVIGAASGRSSLREIVVTSQDAGGCAVNLGDGIASLGAPLHVFATMGNPRHAAFDDFAAKCASVTSWGREPGRTLALEFQDGKYMLSSVSQLGDFNPSLLDEVLADGQFAATCATAKLITLTNWTLYPHMNACWAKLQDEVFSKLPQRPRIFIDLVDPRSRSREDIAAMLEVLRGFEACGPTTFGGNLNEANVVAELLGIAAADDSPEAVATQAAAIRAALDIDEVATHCIACAAVATRDGTAAVTGPYTPTPAKSTGAGDRYNAGYTAGHLLGLDAEQRALLGVATSGFFVRNTRSGSASEIADLLDAWVAGMLAD